jgi:hypothetical protein
MWSDELRLDLRVGTCQAEIRGAGWRRRLLASASATGTGAAAISAALSALRLVDDTTLLPADARLTVADEYVCYALLDASVPVQQALEEATQQFVHALGREDLIVQVSALPDGHGWLAAALLEAHLHAWADVLADAGVRLQHLHPALVQDLSRIAYKVREDDAVIALLRDQGATFIRLDQGVPAALAWEPCDVEDRGALDRRMQNFIASTAMIASQRADGLAGGSDERPATYVYNRHRRLSHYGGDDAGDSSRVPPDTSLGSSSFEQALAIDPIEDEIVRRLPTAQRNNLRSAPARSIDAMDTIEAAEFDISRRRLPSGQRNLRPVAATASAGGPGAAAGTAALPAAARQAGDVEPPQRRSGSSAAFAALADRLRAALNHARSRRHARRLAREHTDAHGQVVDFSPTGSLIPDEWQDTQQDQEEQQEQNHQTAAATTRPQPAPPGQRPVAAQAAANPGTARMLADDDPFEALEAEQGADLARWRRQARPAALQAALQAVTTERHAAAGHRPVLVHPAPVANAPPDLPAWDFSDTQPLPDSSADEPYARPASSTLGPALPAKPVDVDAAAPWQDRRRHALPAALVWPQSEFGQPMDLDHLPDLVDEVSLPEHDPRPGAASYEGVDRRRSHRA